MGFGGSVRCDCWEAGRTSEPPVPREWLYLDDDDYLSLYCDCGSDEEFEKFLEWRESACEHPGTYYASERISSYSGCSEFDEALWELGSKHFPTLLHSYGCECNSNVTPPGSAYEALEELAYLRSLDAKEVKSVLEETTELSLADFNGIISRLEAVFQASVETGNPVRWG